MTNDSKLKIAIREEIDKATKILSTSVSTPVSIALVKQWLSSLQRINDICKDRNRY